MLNKSDGGDSQCLGLSNKEVGTVVSSMIVISISDVKLFDSRKNLG